MYMCIILEIENQQYFTISHVQYIPECTQNSTENKYI